MDQGPQILPYVLSIAFIAVGLYNLIWPARVAERQIAFWQTKRAIVMSRLVGALLFAVSVYSIFVSPLDILSADNVFLIALAAIGFAFLLFAPVIGDLNIRYFRSPYSTVITRILSVLLVIAGLFTAYRLVFL